MPAWISLKLAATTLGSSAQESPDMGRIRPLFKFSLTERVLAIMAKTQLVFPASRQLNLGQLGR